MANPVQKQYERNSAGSPLRMIPDRLRSNCFCGEKADVLGELQLIYRVRRLSLFLSKDIIPSLPSIYFFEPLFGHIIQAGHRHTIRAGTL